MILDRIVEDRKIQLEAEMKKVSIETLKASIKKGMLENKISFYDSIKSYDGISIIAEIKKASPSKGIIKEDFNAEEIAFFYQESDVQAVSVLTEKKNFKGNNDYLVKARQILTKPILRKDFIIDSYQIYHSCYLGADCILLIAAILDDMELSKFQAIAEILGMDVLVEVHNEEELSRVLSTNARIIGINNRDLRTFEVNLENTEKLMKMIPNEKLVISESGINSSKDIKYLQNIGVDGVLVGEMFMRSKNIKKAVNDLRRMD
jgi:indole-3-glycerol phosphate synthase